MTKYIVIANWKMNPDTATEAKRLFASLARLVSPLKKTIVAVAPSFVHLPLLHSGSKKLFLAAQDVSPDDGGAFTGQVSAKQLSDLGVKYVIVGHSERRALGESDDMINRKVKAVLRVRLSPVICVGEKIHDTQGGYLLFLANEIRSAFRGISRADLSRITIAYEPIWAIGKMAKDAMKPSDLHETVLYIRKILTEIYGRETAKKVPMLYGGSVGGENTASLLEHGAISGFLVGGASLSSETFGPILKTVDRL